MKLPRANPDVVYCAVEDGAVLLLTSEEVYFGLNEVGAKVWELLPPRTRCIEELCRQLAGMYPDADPEMIRGDVTDLLSQLEEHGLVAGDSEAA